MLSMYKCMYIYMYFVCLLSSGPQPNWDPDIVAALDNPDMNFDLDDQLEDDFILQVS